MEQEKELNFEDTAEFSVIADFDSSSEDDYRHEIAVCQSIKGDM